MHRHEKMRIFLAFLKGKAYHQLIHPGRNLSVLACLVASQLSLMRCSIISSTTSFKLTGWLSMILPA